MALSILLALSFIATRLEGLVVEVEPSQGIVVVAHAPTKAMPAMTMPFRVSKAAQLAGVKPGLRIRFKTSGSNRTISNLQIIKADLGEQLRIPAPANQLKIGDLVPDFSLTGQDARPARLSDSRGSVTLIDFIYTRCPMPDVCPRLSANFAYISKKLPEARLLTITLDPGHDTPEVLREYAARFSGNMPNWRFLTGEESKIREVGGLFGLVYWPEDGVITHTSATAVIGPDGRLAALVEGTSYRAGQLLALASNFLK